MSAISLPKFLVADDGGDREFVLHMEHPRFVLELMDDLTLEPVVWFDSQPDFIANELANGREPAQTLARLMREAGEFYLEQCE